MIKKYLVLTNDKSNSIIFKLFYKCYKKFTIIKSYQLYHKLYNFKNFLSNFTLAPLNKFSRKKQVQSRKIKKNTDLIAPIFKNIQKIREEDLRISSTTCRVNYTKHTMNGELN